MNNTGFLTAATAAFSALCCMVPASLIAQGQLTPPGPPAPSMKSLDQIEARTPIDSLPFVISTPGSYYLTKSFSVTSGDGITISSSDVSVDLNGFSISSSEATPAGTGILISGFRHNLSIRNGVIRGQLEPLGNFSGSGFLHGIHSSLGTTNARISHVAVNGCLKDGIGTGSIVENCSVRSVGGVGIIGGAIHNCVAQGCETGGIIGTTVSNSDGESSSGNGIFAATATNCKGSVLLGSATDSGLFATNATNCTGDNNSSGIGIQGTVVRDCTASSRFGKGIVAKIVDGCYANCYGGTSANAIEASVISNSYGETVLGIGIAATTVSNSLGQTGAGTGILANNVINSFGKSGSATGSFGIQGGNAGVVQNSAGQASGTGSIGIQGRTVSYSRGAGTAIGVQGLSNVIGSTGTGTTTISGVQFLPP